MWLLPPLPRHILAQMPGERATLETLRPPPTHTHTHTHTHSHTHTHTHTLSHWALSPGEVTVLLKCKTKIPPQLSCILKLK